MPYIKLTDYKKMRLEFHMTIYDIAKLAGVSYATVSRVINNREGVKPETRKKVQKILDENDFLPNKFARGLVTSSMKIIGINVIDVRNIHHIETAFHIEQEFSKYGYTCIICGCGHENEKQEEYIRVMAERQVDGQVLIGSGFQNKITKSCIKKYFNDKPVIIANGYLDLPNVYSVVLDEEKAVKEAVIRLYEKGHHNIAFFNNYDITESSKLKEKGFVEGIIAVGIEHNEKRIIHVKSDLKSAEDQTEKLLNEQPEITAIIYSEDIMAAGGIRSCHNLNIKIPDDLSIIGFNNSIYSDITYPRLSSIDNKTTEMGEVCTKTLYSLLNGENMDKVYRLEPVLVEKETTK